MEYTVCAAVKSRVYTTVEANSFEEAMKKVREQSNFLDYDNEEWVSTPTPVYVQDKTGKIKEF